METKKDPLTIGEFLFVASGWIASAVTVFVVILLAKCS